MFDISPDKLVVLLVIALIVLGPGRLGEAARALGRLRAQLRQLSGSLPPDTAKLIRDPRGALFDVLAEPRQAMTEVSASARQAIKGTTEQEPPSAERARHDGPR
jgi:sec-independent protein translocase protein TatB